MAKYWIPVVLWFCTTVCYGCCSYTNFKRGNKIAGIAYTIGGFTALGCVIIDVIRALGGC